MKKIYTKLIIIALSLVLSVCVVGMSSYAWLVLSSNPVATGIQVSIGGGNAILIAPDVTQVVDGKVYHYPGAFSDKMDFSRYESYDYLKDLGGLTPVSTADGVHWFLPAYFSANDEAVRKGEALSGEIKDIKDFKLDSILEYGNLSANEAEKIEEGNYIYLDFWVVAPSTGYTLRLSVPTSPGDGNGGSFLVDLMQPTQDQDGNYALTQPEGTVTAAARVGFLANLTRLTDETMRMYQNSPYFDARYTSLQGFYLEPGIQSQANQEANRFTIYEPNGDWHPGGMVASGSYVETKPIALVDGIPTELSISDRLTVQRRSLWTEADIGAGTAIEQRFQAAIRGMNLADMEDGDIMDAFYSTYLQGQISPYVTKGAFIKRTADLYRMGTGAAAEQLDELDYGGTTGATEDVFIIRLERDVPQRIRMFIWLEGQDVDCVNSGSTSSFALNLELAGGTQ